MDMFKLLARSTSIQKSAPTLRTTSDPHIPSAGYTKQFQDEPTIIQNPAAQSSNAARGVKRKRSGDGTDGQSISSAGQKSKDVIQDDIFPEESQIAGGSMLDSRKTETQDVQYAGTIGPALSEEECRRILRRRKIRITVVQQPKNTKGEDGNAQENVPNKPRKGNSIQLLPQPLTGFDSLRRNYGVSKRLIENLKSQGYKEPTEVQLGSLPLLLGSNEDRGLSRGHIKKPKTHGRDELDLLTVAPTGSGKTLSFMIHLLHSLLEDRRASQKVDSEVSGKHQVKALIIAPTHELADQIVNEGRKLAMGTGIKVSGLRKGMRLTSESLDSSKVAAEDDGVAVTTPSPVVKADIVVSTPLLLLHAISGKDATTETLPEIRFLVLDEADVLLDPLFCKQTLGIWGACTHPSLRTSLWSATIGSSIESLAQSFILNRRRKLGLRSKHHHIVRLVVGLKDSVIPNIAHRLIYAASEQGKLLALRQLLHPSATPSKDISSLQPPFLIFTQTISRASALYSELLYDIPSEAGGSSRIAVLHSDLSDTARSNVMAGFRRGEIWILITTDLLARGVDFRGINGVVNYDIPNTGAAYVHRVGRTGRQGREGGVAVTLYTKDDIPYMKNVANVIANSEKARGKESSLGLEGKGMQKWLLDALPNVSKKSKQELKRKGVESRRTGNGDDEAKLAGKMRISTKSGYDRRLENKKKGAVAGSRRRQALDDVDEIGSEDHLEEWGGIDD